MKDDSYSKRRYHDGQLGTNHGLAFPKESYDSHTENNTFEFRRNLAHRYEPFLEDEQHRNVQKMVEEKYDGNFHHNVDIINTENNIKTSDEESSEDSEDSGPQILQNLPKKICTDLQKDLQIKNLPT